MYAMSGVELRPCGQKSGLFLGQICEGRFRGQGCYSSIDIPKESCAIDLAMQHGRPYAIIENNTIC